MNKKQRKRLWKEKKEEVWQNSSPSVFKRDIENRYWECHRVDLTFVAEIKGIKLQLHWFEQGKPESYGGKILLARHFLEKKDWHHHTRECFGEEVFQEMYNCLKMAYDKYQSNT